MQDANTHKNEHIDDVFKKQHPKLSKNIDDISIEMITVKVDANIRNELRISFKGLILFGLIGLAALAIYLTI